MAGKGKGEMQRFESSSVDLATALSIITGIPTEELLSKQWTVDDLQERTRTFDRVFTAVVDNGRSGRVTGLTMSETEPVAR